MGMFVIELRPSDVRLCVHICTARAPLMCPSVPACVCVLLKPSLHVFHLVVRLLIRASMPAACVVPGTIFEVRVARVQRVPQRGCTCVFFLTSVNRRCVV